MKKKIEWNSVTWYSKILAGSVFVLLPLVTFYIGVRLGFFLGSTPAQVNIYMPRSATETYKTYTNKDVGFSLEYPSAWISSESSDQYTLASFGPANGQGAVKVYLQKNSYKDIYALKAAVDKRIGTPAESFVKHTQNFDALVYGKLNGAAVMYVPITKDVLLGITGPDNSSTFSVLDSFTKL
ncbi:MAG: hypothetical protein LiPW15_410 [Parcubacteria group bacterium LiPW_15]|nr:MAG: hypothetical protein LiPW15_410 [Parcubacteria group bacterium LiPW_15]